MIKRLHIALVVAFALMSTLANAQAPNVNPVLRARNAWTGQNYQQGICPLQDAQTIVINAQGPCPANTSNYTYGVGMFSVTMTGSGHAFSFTGFRDTTWVLIRVNHGAGPYNPLLPSGTLAPGGAQPSWTNSANSVDDLVCYGAGGAPPNFDSTHVECGGLIVGLASVSGTGIRLVNHASNICADGTSCAVTLAGTSASNLITVGLAWSAQSALAGVTVTSNNGTVCSAVGNARHDYSNNPSGGDPSSDIWVCPNNSASGSVTITASFTQTVLNPKTMIAEWANAAISGVDDGKGASAGGYSTSPVVATNGTLSQANELVLSVFSVGGIVLTGFGSGQTILDGYTSYQLSDTAGSSVTHSATGPYDIEWSASIAALKHQ